MSFSQRVLIVGASLAGLRAAESLRHGGFDGSIVVIGAESYLPYDRPPLSKQLLAGAWEPDRIQLRRDDQYEAMGFEFRLGVQAEALDVAHKTLTLGSGDLERYDALVIATGASPRRLPFGHDLSGVFTLRTIDDALAIRSLMDAGARVVVVGAGFIGSEVASTASSRGLEVTVLEAAPVPLGRVLGPHLGATLGSLHAAHGVDLRLGVSISGMLGSDRVEAVEMTDGTRLPADVVVVGIGAAPTTTWLASSELTISDGVVCDSCLQAVGAPGVFAAGDVCRWPDSRVGGALTRLEHWSNANEQGAAAGANVLAYLRGNDPAPFAPVPFVWSDQYGVRIQFVGYSGPDHDVAVVKGSTSDHKFIALYGRDGYLTGALGCSMPKELMAFRKRIADAVVPILFDDAVSQARLE